MTKKEKVTMLNKKVITIKKVVKIESRVMIMTKIDTCAIKNKNPQIPEKTIKKQIIGRNSTNKNIRELIQTARLKINLNITIKTEMMIINRVKNIMIPSTNS